MTYVMAPLLARGLGWVSGTFAKLAKAANSGVSHG